MYFQGKALLTKRNIFSSETVILDFAKCIFVFHIFRDRHYGRLEQIWRGRRVLRQQSFNTGTCSPYLDHGGGGGDIYIMMHVCLSVTKNDHFLLGVSCNHLNPP